MGQDMSERMSELAVVAPSCTLENLGLLPPLPWLVPPSPRSWSLPSPGPGHFPAATHFRLYSISPYLLPFPFFPPRPRLCI